MDIYDREKGLAKKLDQIQKGDFFEKDKKKVLVFYAFLSAEGLSLSRKHVYISELYWILKWMKEMNKPLVKANKNDIISLINKISTKPLLKVKGRGRFEESKEGEKLSEWSINGYKIVLKKFFKWLNGGKEYPENVKWIKTGVKKRRISKEQVEEFPKPKDIKRMGEVVDNPRDKAFILTLYESGCRIGEFLTLKIKSIKFDEYGAKLIVSGKTGMRSVRVIFSAPALSSWIENHPKKNDSDSYLWVGLGTRNKGNPLTYKGVYALLKKLGDKAEVKKFNPHIFRHARATFVASRLTESVMKESFGWEQGSNMPSVYVHLSGRDTDNAILEMYGIKSKGSEKGEELKAIECPRCHQSNSPIAKFCVHCGLVLDYEVGREIDKRMDEAGDKISKLIKLAKEDPKSVDTLIKLMEKVKRSAVEEES